MDGSNAFLFQNRRRGGNLINQFTMDVEIKGGGGGERERVETRVRPVIARSTPRLYHGSPCTERDNNRIVVPCLQHGKN